jgi:hypothetical protein
VCPYGLHILHNPPAHAWREMARSSNHLTTLQPRDDLARRQFDISGVLEGLFVSRLLLSIIASCFLLFPGAVLGADEQTYDFQQHYLDGQSYTVLFTQQTQIDVQHLYRGQVLDQMKLVDAVQQKGLITVIETQGGVPMTQRIEVDKSSGEFFQMTGQRASQEYGKYAGKTIRTERGASGTLYTIDGEQVPGVTSDLAVWLSRDTTIYPDHPVRLKEKWDLSKKFGYIRGFDDQSVVAFGMLKSIKTIHGRPFAEVIVSAAMEGSFHRQEGLRLEMQLEGPALVDLKSGRIAKMDLTGEVRCAGAADVTLKNGGNVQIGATGGGTLEFHQLSIAAKPQPKVNTAGATFKELP